MELSDLFPIKGSKGSKGSKKGKTAPAVVPTIIAAPSRKNRAQTARETREAEVAESKSRKKASSGGSGGYGSFSYGSGTAKADDNNVVTYRTTEEKRASRKKLMQPAAMASCQLADIVTKPASAGAKKRGAGEKSEYMKKKERNSVRLDNLCKPGNGIWVATDGSSRGFNGKGKNGIQTAGIGIFFPQQDLVELSEGLSEKDGTTNQKAELNAAALALSKIKRWVETHRDHPLAIERKVHIFTDNEYVIKSATMWIDGWESRGWKTAGGESVKYKDVHQKIKTLSSFFKKVSWHHVPSHCKAPESNPDAHDIWAWNDQADNLAQSAAEAAYNERMEQQRARKKPSFLTNDGFDDSDSSSDDGWD